MPRKHITVMGRVQGVGFRYHIRMLADGCRLTGWVRNLDNGDVELEIQGPEIMIDKFLSVLGKNAMFIRIDNMLIMESDEIRESSFDIKY
jgi:Acylphosphatases